MCKNGVQYRNDCIAVLHQKKKKNINNEMNETQTSMFLKPCDMECYLLWKCPFERGLDVTILLLTKSMFGHEIWFWYSSGARECVCQGNTSTPSHQRALFSPNKLHGLLCLEVGSQNEVFSNSVHSSCKVRKKHGRLQVDLLLASS